MLYTVLCYNDENTAWSRTGEETSAAMGRLAMVQERLVKAGRMGPSPCLLPTTAATALRKEKGRD